jgi:hypothetical protein
MELYKGREEKLRCVVKVPTLLVYYEKLQNPTEVANTFNNLFITLTEKLNIQQIQEGSVISILNDSFPRNFPSIKIIPITEAKIKSIIHSLKPKKKS